MFTDFITNMINSLSELLYSHILIILLLERESSLRSKQNSYRSVCLSNLSALSHSRAAIRTDFLPFRLLWYQPLPESEQETSPESQQRSVLADQAQCSGCGLRLFSEAHLHLSKVRLLKFTNTKQRTEVLTEDLHIIFRPL